MKSPLIRRFGEETAMGTYLKYARHRSFSPKPPSERQFDKPRQRGYAARGVFKLGYGEPFFNYSKTRFASFVLELEKQRIRKLTTESFVLRG